MDKNKPKKRPKEGYQLLPFEDSVNFFYSYDLGLATALVCAHFKLASLERGDKRKVQFVFERTDGLDGVVDEYWSDRLEVKARSYFDTLKMLKNRLYSE